MSKEIEELKELAKIYRELAQILDEAVELEEDDNISDKEAEEKTEEMIGRFLIKSIKAKKILEGIR